MSQQAATENQQQQTNEATVYRKNNGQLVVDEGDSGFVLHQPTMYDGEIEEINFDGEATEESNTEVVEENLDLSIFDDVDSPNSGDAQTEQTEEKKEETVEFTKFSEDFKKHIGIDLKEAMTLVQELQTFKAQQAVAQQETQLMSSWGVDANEFNSRMSEVRTYAADIQQKNPDLFAKLDNPEGVKLIWAKIEQQRGGQKQAKTVPQVQRSTQKQPAQAQPRYDFTMSQLQKMSREEYAAKSNVITQAFALGRVDTKR